MESRAIQSRIHFFEYYSLEKFEEYYQLYQVSS